MRQNARAWRIPASYQKIQRMLKALVNQWSAPDAHWQSNERHFDSSLLHHAKVRFRNTAVGDDLV